MKANEWLNPDYGYNGGMMWIAVEHIESGRITVYKGGKSYAHGWTFADGLPVKEVGCHVIGCYPVEAAPTYEIEE